MYASYVSTPPITTGTVRTAACSSRPPSGLMALDRRTAELVSSLGGLIHEYEAAAQWNRGFWHPSRARERADRRVSGRWGEQAKAAAARVIRVPDPYGIRQHGQVHHQTPAGVRQGRENAHRPDELERRLQERLDALGPHAPSCSTSSCPPTSTAPIGPAPTTEPGPRRARRYEGPSALCVVSAWRNGAVFAWRNAHRLTRGNARSPRGRWARCGRPTW